MRIKEQETCLTLQEHDDDDDDDENIKPGKYKNYIVIDIVVIAFLASVKLLGNVIACDNDERKV